MRASATDANQFSFDIPSASLPALDLSSVVYGNSLGYYQNHYNNGRRSTQRLRAVYAAAAQAMSRR